MSQCQAYAHRYVGKGKDRMKYEGPCVLEERGHDGECLPASLAYANMSIQAYNEGLHAALAIAMTVLGSQHSADKPPTEDDIALANTMRNHIQNLRKEPIA